MQAPQGFGGARALPQPGVAPSWGPSKLLASPAHVSFLPHVWALAGYSASFLGKHTLLLLRKLIAPKVVKASRAE